MSRLYSEAAQAIDDVRKHRRGLKDATLGQHVESKVGR